MGSSPVHGSIADPMFIEAAIFDAAVSSSGLLHVAMAQPVSPLHLQVGTIPSSGLLVQGNKSYADLLKTSHSLPRGKAIVGEVDPLVGGSLPLSSTRGFSYANRFMAALIQEDNVSSPSILSKKGGYVAVRVDPSAYKSRLEEYWHPKIISDLARGIGVPLWLDKAIVEGDFGHFARVLVDIDMSTVPPSSLLLERDDSHSSFISMEYENLPAFCSACSSIGHFPNVCHWNKSDKRIPVSSSKPDSARDGPATVVADEGFQVPHKHAPKLVFPHAEVLISNVFAVIQ
ncbi:hypothetical protein LWI29_017716 [Acer saccharum]|uniref:DUF4283 domain-containing protein n=1 Tax=Acer saccharum TaxID=4024 RepID=A0AA39RZ41_ACESA|nr:hypothetical protein LWI29_017716 [Acer saccharum]